MDGFGGVADDSYTPMTDRTAATSLRLLGPRARVLGPGDGDSLQNVNTTNLPNGSLCWVNANATLYRLDKTSTAGTAPDAIIVPASGPGRWFALVGGAFLENMRMSMFSPDEPTVTVGTGNQNKWLALPVDQAGPYGPQVLGSILWDIESTTGVATYSGPRQVFHFTASLNAAPDAEATTEVQLALSINGLNIGTTNAFGLQQRSSPFDGDHFEVISLANELVIETGDTVELVVRNVTSEDDLILAGIQIIGIPVGTAPSIT